MKSHPTEIRVCCYPNWLHLHILCYCYNSLDDVDTLSDENRFLFNTVGRFHFQLCYRSDFCSLTCICGSFTSRYDCKRWQVCARAYVCVSVFAPVAWHLFIWRVATSPDRTHICPPHLISDTPSLPSRNSHTHAGDSTQVRLIFQLCVSARACASVRVCASVCEFRGAGLRQRVRAYDSSVSAAAASQARFILFRNMLADCSVAPSLNRCEARPTHSRRRTRGGRRIPIYKIDDFHFPALNGFYNVA